MDQLADVSTALLLTSPLSHDGEAVCFEHLVRNGEPPGHVLTLLFTGRPERRLEKWDRHVGDRPDAFTILASQLPATEPDGVEVEMVDRPGDLTDIGVAVTERVADWPPDEPTAFCLHSVTAQLQYADDDRVYRFLRTLLDHLAERDVTAHVHMNPAAHEDQTVATLETLFDAVVEVDDEGTSIRTV